MSKEQIRNSLLSLFGQASAIYSLSPESDATPEIIKATSETAGEMMDRIRELIMEFPKN